MSKQILILNGSPRIHGNTAALIDAFTAGAEAAGHLQPVQLGQHHIQDDDILLRGERIIQAVGTVVDLVHLIFLLCHDLGQGLRCCKGKITFSLTGDCAGKHNDPYAASAELNVGTQCFHCLGIFVITGLSRFQFQMHIFHYSFPPFRLDLPSGFWLS